MLGKSIHYSVRMTDPAPVRRTPLQTFWLVIYWVGFAVVASLVIQSILGAVVGDLTISSVAIVCLAAAASLIGCIFSVRISGRRLSDTVFVKFTTTVRVIAVGWVLIGIVINLVPIIEVLAGLDGLANDEWTSGFLGTVGSISFLAVWGPGYSDYRQAMSAAEAIDSPVTTATVAPPAA